MKIGLIDIDRKKFPNLALMKISAYHKRLGDYVEFTNLSNYDKTYISKIFTFSQDNYQSLSNLGEIVKGGYGYNFNELSDEIEHIMPDYSLYKTDKAYGFLTRGCPNKCSWCIVPEKEGKLRDNADITEFWNGQKEAILLDNNILASGHGLKQIEKIIDLKIKVDFNQGLDARIISNNKNIAKLLSRVKWSKPLRMACDSLGQMGYIEKATNLLRKYNTTPKRYFVYVLVKEIDDALKRVNFLLKLNLDPYAQAYIDSNGIIYSKEAERFERYVNHKAILKSCTWNEYRYK